MNAKRRTFIGSIKNGNNVNQFKKNNKKNEIQIQIRAIVDYCNRRNGFCLKLNKVNFYINMLSIFILRYLYFG